MVKTPEQYFTDQRFDMPEHVQGAAMSAAEQAFIQKYVGEDCIQKLGIDAEGMAAEPVIPADSDPLQVQLAAAESVQMIFYELAGQVYCIPIDAVQEVIRYIQPTALPLAPPHVAGIINLRGRVTPLIALDHLLGNTQGQINNASERFIIVCMRHGLQVGLIVERIQNMITIKQNQMLWNVESQLGANAEYLCGIVEYREKVFGIVSIDMLVDYIIKN